MFRFLICLILFLIGFLSSTVGDSQNTYVALSNVPKGLTVHNILETWSEAHIRCQNEGAILASPINEHAFNDMKAVIGITNAMFHTGIKARSPGQFVSVEGVPLESMDISLWQQLDEWNGDCLAMTVDRLHVVPCETRLPYICNKIHAFDRNKTNCGPGYKYDVPTKNCYKVHKEYEMWHKAQMTCVSEGANLVVIDNELEAKSVTNIYGQTSYVWVGLRDQTGNGNWISVHWQPVEDLYNVWLGGHKTSEPNVNKCGTFHFPNHLNRGHCNITIDFICEKEPTYE